MRGRLLREEGGFTLAEMLVTMTVMITVLFALYSIFDMSIRVFSFGNDKVEAVENARLGLEKMEREIRAAYKYDASDAATNNDHLFFAVDPTSGAINAATAAMPTETRITFGNDLDGNQKIQCPTPETPSRCEYITYKQGTSDGGAGRSLRRVNSSNANDAGDPVVRYLRPPTVTPSYPGGLTFKYLTAGGIEINPASPGSYTQADIARVQITLEIEVPGVMNGTQTLTTDVYLRNRT